MVVLALILLLLVAVVVISAVLGGDGTARLNLIGADIVTTERVLFLAGVATAAVAGIALYLLVKGTQRARKRRNEWKQLREAAAQPPHPERHGRDERSDDRDHESRGWAAGHAPVGPDAGPEYRPDLDTRSGHPSTGPGRGVRSPTDPGEYHGPNSRPGDDERDHFETLPRD
jgi:hypothetical protein